MEVYIILIDEISLTNGTIISTIVDSVWTNFDKAAERVENLLHADKTDENTISYPYINVQVINN